jgi:hypothetical protein
MAGDAARFDPAPEHWIRDAVRLQLDLEAFDGTQFVVRWLRTLHHPANAAAIGMNRRLGFAGYGPRAG